MLSIYCQNTAKKDTRKHLLLTDKQGNYTGLLPTCQRRGNRLKYTYDERRRTASPSGRKSKPQSVGSGTAPVERAIGPGQCPDQGARRQSGQRQSNEQ